MTFNWAAVADQLDEQARALHWGAGVIPTEGQRNTVAAIAVRLRAGQRSLLLADEVGMGKTLIAAALIKAVQAAGGRSAAILPPGLGAQWQAELRKLDPEDATLLPLRSYQTFLDGFKRPEDVADRDAILKRRFRELADRRKQRELPKQQWFDEPILLLSHNLGSIRKTDATQVLHQGLVDAVLKVARKVRKYRRDPKTGSSQNNAREVAERIFDRLNEADRQALLARIEPGGRAKRVEPVDGLCSIVAHGLGRFDLLVIDEAHKARGANSSLSRVIGDMTWMATGAFRLGLTATPVELDVSQWSQTFDRLGLPEATLKVLVRATKDYVDAVDELRTKVALTPASVERYRDAAQVFQTTLSPWVLRRDLREDAFIKDFQRCYGSHRCISPIEVSLPDMPLQWRRAFLASEAMSLLEEHALTPAQRRLRLSLPDGRKITGYEEAPGSNVSKSENSGQLAWASLAQQAMGEGGTAIFSHPAIMRAVEEIEGLVAQGQKVLVFGRYTRPMRALTFLLDAREMVRCLCTEEGARARWPGSKLALSSCEREAALETALADRKLNVAGLDRATLEARMTERAERHQSGRRDSFTEARKAIYRPAASGEDEAAMLADLWRAVETEAGLLSALEEQRPASVRDELWTEEALKAAFVALIREVCGHAEERPDDSVSGYPRLRELLREHLGDFGARESHFARLMDGSTAPRTRRLLQSAFSREGSWPQVLVAQSTVAREGLNLQAACRAVVMLHLEWNPGNVEQQIGRVDRLGSRWRREAEMHKCANGGDPPRILIRPVLVRGTYADHHWSVLQQRWDNLRAQLNGEVLPPSDLGEQDQHLTGLLAKVRDAAPSFSPRRP